MSFGTSTSIDAAAGLPANGLVFIGMNGKYAAGRWQWATWLRYSVFLGCGPPRSRRGDSLRGRVGALLRSGACAGRKKGPKGDRNFGPSVLQVFHPQGGGG